MKKLLFLVFVIFFTGCSFFGTSRANLNDDFVNNDDYINGVALIDEYTIYGRYFNIKGEINEEISDLVLVLKSESQEKEFNLILELGDKKTKFRTNELINEGINLDNILAGDYIVLLKSKDNYYTLKNKTSYEDLLYYTISKEKENRKINIYFKVYDNKSFLYLNCEKTNLPSDIYDIVIDPGHGGTDPGAMKNGYSESNINLDYAKSLKEKLENYGLKVKLTRDSDISIPNYGDKGRVSVPYKTKAKLMLSIHMNSSIYNVGQGGVEIYIPGKINTRFAANLAKNIVGFTSSEYSSNLSNKVSSGVYFRTLSKNDLEGIKEEAIKNGYIPYEKAGPDSVYYYIIRETGGIITDAYVDLRNKEKDGNIYHSSNHGCETYLLELGYINSSSNLNILLKEKDAYVKAIALSVLEYLEI